MLKIPLHKLLTTLLKEFNLDIKELHSIKSINNLVNNNKTTPRVYVFIIQRLNKFNVYDIYLIDFYTLDIIFHINSTSSYFTAFSPDNPFEFLPIRIELYSFVNRCEPFNDLKYIKLIFLYNHKNIAMVNIEDLLIINKLLYLTSSESNI